MRAELPVYTIAPGFRRLAAPTGLSPPQLISRPTCCISILIVVLLLGVLATAAIVGVGNARHDFRSNANKHN